jgi:hypothetical protein
MGNMNNCDLERKLMLLLDFIMTLKRIVICKVNHKKDHILGKAKKTFFEFLILLTRYEVVNQKGLQFGL